MSVEQKTHLYSKQDANKHTSTGHSLPDSYLQNTCKFAAPTTDARATTGLQTMAPFRMLC